MILYHILFEFILFYWYDQVRDGHITRVEVRVEMEQRRALVVFGPNGAKTRWNQEGKENKVLSEVRPNTFGLNWSSTRRCGVGMSGSRFAFSRSNLKKTLFWCHNIFNFPGTNTDAKGLQGVLWVTLNVFGKLSTSNSNIMWIFKWLCIGFPWSRWTLDCKGKVTRIRKRKKN